MAAFSSIALGAAVAGSLASAAISKSGSDAAGNAAAGAANAASQQSMVEAARSRAAASPWTASGTSSLQKITNLLGLGSLVTDGTNNNTYGMDPANAKGLQTQALADFQTTPGYQFRMDEGSKALDRSAASRGLLRSGAQQKAITDFGQNIASGEYGNYLGSLFSLAGMGGQAVGGANNTSAGLTQGAGNMLTQGGIARGSAYASGANAIASGIGSGINNAIGGAYLFRNVGGSKPSGSGTTN